MNPLVEPTRGPRKNKKLLEQTHDIMRLKHYSYRTERSYCQWVERFIRYDRTRHPREMREAVMAPFMRKEEELPRRVRYQAGAWERGV